MHTCIDEFVSKKNKITIVSSLHNYNKQQASTYLNSLGTCERLYIKSVSDIEKLSKYYLVWYTINEEGLEGWDKTGSYNYTVYAFTRDFIENKINSKLYIKRIKQLKNCIKKLKDGLNQPVNIRVAYHSTLKKALVVDGVKRIISLYYLMLVNPEILDGLLSSEHSISIVQFTSKKAQDIFPGDFHKLQRNILS